MQLTRFTDFSLRVLMYLANRPSEERTSLEFLATTFNMNRHHLNKVSQRLTQLGWVISARGKQGGVSIAPRALDLNLGEIVRTLEPEIMPIDCVGVECPIAGKCKFEDILGEASGAFLAVLSQYTLADLTPRQAQRIKEIFNS